MKKMAMLIGILVTVSGVAQATIMNTWNGGTLSWYAVGQGSSQTAVMQRFTVPAGKMATQFEFFGMQHSSWIGTAGYITTVRVFATGSYTTPLATKAYAWNDPIWTGGQAWLPLTNLNLAPGQYDAELVCNTHTVATRFYAGLQSNSTYSGGYAADGWAVSPAVEKPGADFQARVTLVPEPATLSLVLLSGVAWLRRRK